MLNYSDLLQRDYKVIARPTRRIPIILKSAKNSELIDVEGNKFIDLTSGWNVANTGWNHPSIVESVKKAIPELSFSPPWCSHLKRIELGEVLSDFLGGEWNFLGVSSGTEAVDHALKIARAATGRKTIVSFSNTYHGGTANSLMASGVDSIVKTSFLCKNLYRFLPLPYSAILDNNYFNQIEKTILQEPLPAAVLLEPIFTNPGVIYGNDVFYSTLQRICEKENILIIMDEVGTGFARTGKMFGFQHWPIKPDLICMAKALSSGVVPIGATAMKPQLSEFISGPGFSSTFGWTPLACVAALATTDVIQKEGLIEKSNCLGQQAKNYLEKLLESCKLVKSIRGVGLEIAIELCNEDNLFLPKKWVNKILDNFLKKGIFVESSIYTSSILIMPPLNIEKELLFSSLDILIQEIFKVEADRNSSNLS